MEVRGNILNKLQKIEKEHGIRIPIAIESGSRAWGFASPNSDYDCRFIYVKPKERYLTVFEEKDTIEETPDAVYDIGGWDVKKVVQHLVKSNAVMLEWLSSGITYRMDEEVREELWSLGKDFFNPVSVCWHYLSMAKKKLEQVEEGEQAKIKTYCYILRPLACIRFIGLTGEIPFMEYQKNLDIIMPGGAVKDEIEKLLKEKKTAPEGFLMPQNPVLLQYFKEECKWAEKRLSTWKHEKNRDTEKANRTFRQIIDMVYSDGK